jgi:DNA methylase
VSEARMLVGDVFDQLADVEPGSVDLVATSPPFWRQRAYLPADHPDKAKEIGQEATPAEFIDTMLRLTAELARVLAPHGSIAVELADTSAGSGGAGGDYNPGGFRDGQPKWKGSANGRSGHRGGTRPGSKQVRVPNGSGHQAIPDLHGKRQPGIADGPLAKSLCMIPEAYRFALSWGIVPFTGRPSPAGQWIVRNVVDWCRPNPTPGDDGDKFRRATSDIAIATLSPRRYWDGEAVRVPASEAGTVLSRANVNKGHPGYHTENGGEYTVGGTRPLYDWWEITPQQYSGAHYAVWTPEIARRLILSMCPQRVCRTCGQPSRRIVETSQIDTGRTTNGRKNVGRKHETAADYPTRTVSDHRTVGWTDCGHDNWRRGHVLDPFGGSGTTAAVATGLGRDATLIDLDDRNLDLARHRIGMFLEVAEPAVTQ